MVTTAGTPDHNLKLTDVALAVVRRDPRAGQRRLPHRVGVEDIQPSRRFSSPVVRH